MRGNRGVTKCSTVAAQKAGSSKRRPLQEKVPNAIQSLEISALSPSVLSNSSSLSFSSTTMEKQARTEDNNREKKLVANRIIENERILVNGKSWWERKRSFERKKHLRKQMEDITAEGKFKAQANPAVEELFTVRQSSSQSAQEKESVSSSEKYTESIGEGISSSRMAWNCVSPYDWERIHYYYDEHQDEYKQRRLGDFKPWIFQDLYEECHLQKELERFTKNQCLLRFSLIVCLPA